MERLIDKYLPADYHDTFVLKSRKPAEQIIPKELIKKIFNHSPAWLNFLMKVRNILVKPLGLETGKVLKTEDCIIEDTENEAIMRKDDKHSLVSGKLLLRIRKYLINNIFRGQTPVHDLKCLHLQSVS